MTWLRDRGTHGCELTDSSPPPLASSSSQRPVRGPKAAVSSSPSAFASSPNGRDIQRGKLFRGFGSDAPECVDSALGHLVHPVRVGQREDSGWLGEPGCDLGALLVVADPHRARQPGLAGNDGADPLGQFDRVVGLRRQVRLVPAPHLERVAEVAQQTHHLLGGGVVGVGVRGQEYRFGAAACGGPQRHPGMNTEFACLIGRAGDDLAGFGRIAVAADDHRQADQFGAATQFDRGQKLVEVDMKNPGPARDRCRLAPPTVGGHCPQSLRATLSHASPSCSRVRPRTASWYST